MKKFSTLMSLLVAVSLVIAPVAEAKKMGGKSYGRTYKTAPAPAKSQPQSNNTLKESSSASSNKSSANQQQNQASQQQKSSRWGMLGGALAGLAAGGLLASLFGGGAFSGMQGLDFLVLILLAVGAFLLFRKFKRSAAAGAMGQNRQQPQEAASPFAKRHSMNEPQGMTANGADAQFLEAGQNHQEELPEAKSGNGIVGGHDVPLNLPGGFDAQAFLNGARDHYHKLQQAWNDNDLNVMREYLAPELFQQLEAERQQLQGKQFTEILFVDADIVRADYTARVAQISVKYTGRYRDQKENIEEDINDIWHLERDILQSNAPWFIVGME